MGAGLGLFALRRRPPDRLIARRWASFVGPLRAKLWRADDWAGPAGRVRIRASEKPAYGLAAITVQDLLAVPLFLLSELFSFLGLASFRGERLRVEVRLL